MTFSLSTIMVSPTGEQLYTFEDAASITNTSIAIVQIYVQLGLIEPMGELLHFREITRIAQIRRLHRDLGLNMIGAAMVLDMAQEIAQLQARLRVYQTPTSNTP